MQGCLQTELWSVASLRFDRKRESNDITQMTSQFEISINIILFQGGAVALSAALKYPGEWG